MKRCSGCKIQKAFDCYRKDKKAKDGYRHSCKDCQRKWNNSYKKSHPPSKATRRNETLKHKYGITTTQYEQMLQAQKGLCKICEQVCTSGKRLAVDHCHSTNKVRGLLCRKCNLGIGNFRDTPELLEKAADYLRGP